MKSTYLEINLSNLKHNYNHIRSFLNPETKFLAVVKANGYGNGSMEVSKCLSESGVDYFGVAYVREGVELRNQGIKKPILVFHPQLENLQELINYNLEPSIYSLNFFNNFLSILKSNNKKLYPIQINFNTGLNRLGFSEKYYNEVINKLNKNNSLVKLKGVYSHLASSDDLGEDYFNMSQITKFEKIIGLIKPIFPNVIFHLLNTSGVMNYKNYQFDMVRAGISLYGYSNDNEIDKFLKPVLTLKTIISQIHKIKKGDSVGYNRSLIAKKNMSIATIPLGHSYGITRIYGNGKGYVYVKGKKAFIVGNVCMDMLMLDVSAIECKEGDEVVVVGENASAEALANSAGTISYELLTGLSDTITRRVIVG